MKKFFYLGISVFFLILWFKLVNVGSSVALISQAKLIYILLAILLGVSVSLLISLRQKFLFRIIKKDLSISFLWLMGNISGLSTVILPFFTGGFLFAKLVSQKIKESYIKTFSIVFTDFSLGIFILFLFGLMGMIKWSIGRPIYILGFGTLIFILALVIFSKKIKDLVKIFSKNRNMFFLALLLTLPIYLITVLQSYLFFLAFGLKPNPFEFVLASSAFGVLNLIPGIPTKIGQYEALGILSFGFLLNLDKTYLSAIFLSQHIVSLTISIFLGVLSMNISDVNIFKFKISQER